MIFFNAAIDKFEFVDDSDSDDEEVDEEYIAETDSLVEILSQLKAMDVCSQNLLEASSQDALEVCSRDVDVCSRDILYVTCQDELEMCSEEVLEVSCPDVVEVIDGSDDDYVDMQPASCEQE